MSGWTPPRRDPYVDLADESAHEAAVRARSRERELRERATELAGWNGTLRDLAEARAVVTLRSRSSRTHRGVLVAVAEDHVAMRLPAGQLVALAAGGVTSVRPEPGTAVAPAMGDRDRAQDRTLVELLDRAAGEHRRVALTLDGSSEVVQGTLVAVGDDVLTVRLDGRGHDLLYVRAGAILEVVINPAAP
jgi:hypothetical protein